MAKQEPTMMRLKAVLTAARTAASSFVLIALAATLTGGAQPSVVQSVSSQQALLSPHIHTGSVLTWYATITDPLQKWEKSSCVNCDVSFGVLLACKVTKTDPHGFTLSRLVRSFLANQPHTPTVAHPPIVVKQGYEFTTDGSPLNDDPICLTYSRALYGNPPALISVGTTWRLARPRTLRNVGGLSGTVIVTGVDAQSKSVSLHVSEIGWNAIVEDISLSDGGIVESERDVVDEHPQHSDLPRQISSPNQIVSWSRQEATLDGLWRYPPSAVQPFDVSDPPDILDPNGRFVSVLQLPIPNHPVTLVRIWRFGPFALQALRPSLPNGRDVLLCLGIVLIVLLASRAATITYQLIRGPNSISSGAGGMRLLVEIALAVIAGAVSMSWIYH